MRSACIRQIVDIVHLFGRQWYWGWIQPNLTISVALYQSTGIAWIRFQMQYARGVRIEYGISDHFLIGWQSNELNRTIHLLLTYDLNDITAYSIRGRSC